MRIDLPCPRSPRELVLCAVLLAVAAAWCAALLGAAASAAEGGPAVRSRFRVKNFTVS